MKPVKIFATALFALASCTQISAKDAQSNVAIPAPLLVKADCDCDADRIPYAPPSARVES